ncbi:MAG TPA: NAD(P)/FAD-dependent oxidoreductase [Candidatus Polarisedimenticolaceae bacterium]|nr:NAD(P)/FAD-dependent oxidoreductase [Candidatus Polarisedimenticolaceae bacterium]
MTDECHDLAIVGASAAGLMAAIQAGREAGRRGRPLRVVALDGAARLGAKILVAGGGRCNVTHDVVDERSFSGSSAAAVRNVLRRFDVAATIRFFEELGVPLKREETGKLFPVDDRARSVLEALLRACRDVNVRLLHPWRAASIERSQAGFTIAGPGGSIEAGRVVLATGGLALPKSGSDGAGLAMARRLGHTTAPVFPALVPLVLADGAFVRSLAGIAVPARLTLRSSSGKAFTKIDGPVLCTHFGLSGPAVLDMSRHWNAARREDPSVMLTLDWIPGWSWDDDGTAGVCLRKHLPERLADALCREAGVEPGAPLARLSRERRRALHETTGAWRVPVTGDRGFTHAEVTAGGIPLREAHLTTLESRVCPGLHLAGEILDVDGRIGGYNFQWAWATGTIAGSSAAAALLQDTASRSGGSTPAASR